MQDRPDAVPPSLRRRRARALAEEYGGVLSRALLRTCDVDHEMVRREVAAERWVVHGHQAVSMTPAPLDMTARRWLAVWETGPKVAALDGVSALQHAGLTGFDDETVHVSVKHTAEVEKLQGVHVHKVIRGLEGELVGAGMPRTRPPVAAVRAAHWAVSDRQAALVLVMPVQQRLCTGAQLVDAESLIRGRNRLKLIHVLEELVLRVSLIGWRLMPEAYLDQICAAYWSRAGRRW